jgi:hypothetical protein
MYPDITCYVVARYAPTLWLYDAPLGCNLYSNSWLAFNEICPPKSIETYWMKEQVNGKVAPCQKIYISTIQIKFKSPLFVLYDTTFGCMDQLFEEMFCSIDHL